MGSSFSNINIFHGNTEELSAIFPNCIVKKMSDDWITVIGEEFESARIDGIAKKLSKKIAATVLAVTCIDSDVLLVWLMKDGKLVSEHISGSEYGYYKKAGNAAAFAQALGFNDSEANLLKAVFRCDSLEQKLSLFEAFFGTPLQIDIGFYEYLKEESFYRSRNLAVVEDYITSLPKPKKVKNQTEISIISEIEGFYQGPLFPQLKITNNMEQIYLLSPGYQENRMSYTPYRLNGKGEIKRLDLGGKIPYPSDKLFFDVEGELCFFSRMDRTCRRLTQNTSPPDNSGMLFRADAFPDTVLGDGILFSSFDGGFWKADFTGRELFRFRESELRYFLEYHNGSYLFISGISNAELVKLDQNGQVEARAELPGHMGGPPRFNRFTSGNKAYCTAAPGFMEECLLRFDENLQLEVSLPLPWYLSSEVFLDEKNSRIYISGFQEGIKVVDLSGDMRVMADIRNPKITFVLGADAGGRIYALLGESTIEVYSPELELLSRHRLTGSYAGHSPCADQGFYIVTSNSETYFDSRKKNPRWLRSYHIK